MKIRNNTDTFYTVPFGITKDLLTVKPPTVSLPSTFTDDQMAEVCAQLLAHTKLGNVPANINGFQEAFSYLEAKSEAVRKTLSFWDAYQIRDFLTKGEEDLLLSKISQMPSNSSIIANTSGAWIQNGSAIQYYPGDVFIKDYYNNVNHIPMISTGYYYPSNISREEGSSTYTITYTYATIPPLDTEGSDSEDSNSEDLDSEEKREPEKEMTFDIEPAEEESGYNTSAVLTSENNLTFRKIVLNGQTIHPIIKTFLSDSGEQIFGVINLTTVIQHHLQYFQITKKANVPDIIVTVR